MKEWQKHLERAEELICSPVLFENEMFNDALSEAYYSLFHAANAILSFKDLHPRTHKGLIAEFGLQFVATDIIEVDHGKNLAKTEEKCEKADYDVFYRVSKEKAESIIEDAQNFFERIMNAIDDLID
ncbi:MAG: HEPN domain-containing protein [Methanobacterium formicicum]